MQLEIPPEHLQAIEAKAIRRIAAGPGAWISRDDAWYLAEGYGQAKSCTAVGYLAQAAQFRVACSENGRHSGNSLSKRADALRLLLKDTDNFQIRHRWSEWYARFHILLIQENIDSLSSEGITYGNITSEILGGSRLDQYNCKETDRDKVKPNLQRFTYARIKAKRKPNFGYRLRHKLDRRKLGGVEAITAATIEKRLGVLRKLVAPRVQAAVFSTLWNRWCTPRRFQRRGCQENQCLLGCGGMAEDSIEHYSFCKAVRAVASSMLFLDPTFRD